MAGQIDYPRGPQMLKPGDKFERYTIEAAIGEGGMGAVYRAHDAQLGRRVALKVLTGATAGEDVGARLLREARAAAALDHPNAVALFEVGELNGAPYIAMELVSGRTLRAAIGDASVTASVRVGWLTDVARALAAAHRRGLVHRDIKPENVMVREDGVVKVLDFGIARRTGGADPNASTQAVALPTLTSEGVKLGTPVYMAPEQIRGASVDGRADQFAWGVLAYELLTGRLPWRGADDMLAVLASVLTDEADAAPLDEAGVPPGVREVVLRALAKRPDDRFASMDELQQALGAAARGEAPPPRAAAMTSPAVAEKPPPAPGPTLAQRYSTGEVREVLAQAIERQASKHGDAPLDFHDLLEAAAEVGVDLDTLREASRDLRARKEGELSRADDIAARDAWIRRQRRNFHRHLGVYLIVNAAIAAVLMLIAWLPWFVPLLLPLAWGIGLGIHGLVVLTTNEDDWQEQKASMQMWLESQRRHQEFVLARMASRDQRALDRGERRGGAGRRGGARRDGVDPRMADPRMADPRTADPRTADPRVRIAEEPVHDSQAEAEEEAARAAEEHEGKRRRRRG